MNNSGGNSVFSLIQDWAIPDPTIDGKLDFVIGAQDLTSVKRIGQQSPIIKTISPEHTAPRLRYNFDAELWKYCSAAFSCLEAGEINQDGENPVLTLKIRLEVVSMRSVLLPFFIPHQLQHFDMAGGQPAKIGDFFRDFHNNGIAVALVHECTCGCTPLRLRFSRLSI